FNTTVSSSSSSPSAVSHTKQSDLNVTDTNLSDNIGYVSDDAICLTNGLCYYGSSRVKYDYFIRHVLPTYKNYKKDILVRSSSGYSVVMYSFF
ncbi:MAG: hypothetical protein LHW46_08530, partial [Candidatus Cloacimonetes bacterium]|nr:hypothetical protein [Candidatus Cloacimonadota bacterium]